MAPWLSVPSALTAPTAAHAICTRRLRRRHHRLRRRPRCHPHPWHAAIRVGLSPATARARTVGLARSRLCMARQRSAPLALIARTVERASSHRRHRRPHHRHPLLHLHHHLPVRHLRHLRLRRRHPLRHLLRHHRRRPPRRLRPRRRRHHIRPHHHHPHHRRPRRR
jgi:hypothetical protein